MVGVSTERILKHDWAFKLSRFEGVAINEHFLKPLLFDYVMRLLSPFIDAYSDALSDFYA